MSRFWSKTVHSLTPYVPGEQPKLANLVKLNTNENPYGPSPKALDAMRTVIGDELKLYPDPHSEKLKAAIAAHHGVAQKQVFVGNGSDEVLAHVFHGLLKHDQPLLFPDITYSFYPVYAGLYEIDYRTVPLAEDFSIRVEDYVQPNGGISGEFWFGLEPGNGYDVFTKLLYGIRNSLGISLAVTLATVLTGIVLGVAAGYLGGKTDFFISRVIDFLLAIPSQLFFIASMPVVVSLFVSPRDETPVYVRVVALISVMWVLGWMSHHG